MNHFKGRAEEKFGSGGYATIDEIKKAGLLSGKGLHVGYTREKKPRQITDNTGNSRITFGNSGSGKLTTTIAQTLVDGRKANVVSVDVKPEHRHIAGMNVSANVYSLNGYGLGCDAPHFIPQDSMNAFDAIDPHLPSFFEDVLMFAMSIAEKPKGDGGGNSEHFYNKTLSLVQAVIMDGKSINKYFSPIDLKNIVDDIQTGGGEFFDFHIDRMKGSP